MQSLMNNGKHSVECDPDDVENIVINYKDGRNRTITRGFACEAKKNELTFNLVGMSGNDLSMLVVGCLYLADKLGLLDEKETEKKDHP